MTTAERSGRLDSTDAQTVLQQTEVHDVRGDRGVHVLDELTEGRRTVVADRRLEGEGLAAVAEDLLDPLGRHLEHGADLAEGRLAAVLGGEVTLDPQRLVDLLDHVHRHADGAALVGDRALQCLADPPGRVRRELVALGVVELLDRTHQADVAFLDQVEQRQALALVALGQRNDEAEVGLEQVVAGAGAVGADGLQVATQLDRDLRDLLGVRLADLLLRVEAGLDPLGELDLLLGGEQCDSADVGEVDADEVGRRDLVVPVVVGLFGFDDLSDRCGAGGVGADRDAAAADGRDDALGLGGADARLVKRRPYIGERKRAQPPRRREDPRRRRAGCRSRPGGRSWRCSWRA